MLEELLPTKELEIGILDPAVTQRLIAQVIHVLEKRQACHQPRRQRRAAGAIRIDRSELHLQKPLIDRARKLHQRMRQINDPIQPGAEQILLPGLLSLPRPHRHPPSIISRARNHSLRFEGIAKTICKKAAAPPPNSGKNHYLERLNHPSRSTVWKYFTGDSLAAPEPLRRPMMPRPFTSWRWPRNFPISWLTQIPSVSNRGWGIFIAF